jgi:ABC-type Na+ efflux pump permease subunit
MWLDKLGNWNPQLFREIKGRLKGRNIVIVFYLSLMTQFLYVMCCIQIPSDYNERWGLKLSKPLSVILFCTLVLGGVYMLMSDLAKEEKRGTLNFIRLSPQSSQKILLGKLLGVPVLLYLAILLAIPLHLYLSIGEHIDFRLVVGSYLLVGVICSGFYTAAMLYSFLGGLQPWLGTFSISLLLFPLLPLLYLFLYIGVDDLPFNNTYLRWFNLPLGENMTFAYCFTVASFGAVTYGIWQLLNRRFLNPNTTLISKKQSYFFVFLTNLWLLGFAWPNWTVSDFNPTANYGFLFGIVPFCFLILIGGLSPTRQTLQDWARYQVGRSKKALVQELIWGEKSPSTIALVLNLVITAIIWMPWLLLFNDLSPQNGDHLSQLQVVISFVLMGNMILLWSTISQIILMTKQPKLQRLAGEILGIILTLPLLFGASNPQNFSTWLFSVAPISIKYISNTTIFLLLLSQGTMLTLLSFQLTRQLKKAGESTTQKLLISSRGKISRL